MSQLRLLRLMLGYDCPISPLLPLAPETTCLSLNHASSLYFALPYESSLLLHHSVPVGTGSRYAQSNWVSFVWLGRFSSSYQIVPHRHEHNRPCRCRLTPSVFPSDAPRPHLSSVYCPLASRTSLFHLAFFLNVIAHFHPFMSGQCAL